MIVRRRKKLFEDITVSAAPVNSDSSENKSNSEPESQSPDSAETKKLTDEEKKKKALEEIDKKDDADIMTMVLSGEMPEDEEIRAKIFKRGSDYIQKQMTGTITPDKQKEMYKKILANAGISDL